MSRVAWAQYNEEMDMARRQLRKPGSRMAALKSAESPPHERPILSRAPAWRREGELQYRLDQAQERYSALVKRLPVVTYVAAMDVQAAFTYISPQVETILGYSPEEWIADRSLWLKRMLPEDRRRILPNLGRAHQRGEKFSAEYRLLDRSGGVKWILDESEVVRDKAARPLFIQGMWTEITERKKKERESERIGRELSASRSELAQFVSVASHELKAPLRRIVNLGEMLALRCRDRLDAQAQGLLAQMIGSAATLQKLIVGLVNYGETDQEIPFSAVDLNLSLRHVRKELSEEVLAEGAEITCGVLPEVWAEPALLERVLYHLLDNSIKFHGKKPPRIHISAEQSERQWTISVRDNGIGIGQSQAQRIFSIFDRLHPRREYAGVGLGLAICKKIVEGFGGRIWVESEPEEGSTFHFTLRSPGEAASA